MSSEPEYAAAIRGIAASYGFVVDDVRVDVLRRNRITVSEFAERLRVMDELPPIDHKLVFRAFFSSAPPWWRHPVARWRWEH